MKSYLTILICAYAVVGCGDKKTKDKPHWACPEWSLTCARPPRPEVPKTDEQKMIEASLAKLEELKSKSAGKYVYTVTKSSWVGTSLKRTITVESGVVTKQVFTRIELGTPPVEVDILSEEGSEIGVGGYPAFTLEQLHDDCLNNTASKVSDPNYRVYIRADETTKILTQCVSVDMRCQDDCSVGLIDRLTVE